MLPGAVKRWHTALCLLAAVNVALWSLAAVTVFGDHADARSGSDFAARIQLLLSAAYVVGCAFRSLLPVYDIPRLIIVDSRLSSVLLGRSVATVAELCFAAQWAYFLYDIAAPNGGVVALTASLAIMPIIVCAEVCSWHAVLTTSQHGHILENSLWGVAAALVVAGLLALGPLHLAASHPAAMVWLIGGATYVTFLIFVDVPMYLSRWRVDQASGRLYFSLAQGFADAGRRRIVSHRWEDWRSEALWMTPYFSLGVWSSISLVFVTVAT